MNVRAYRRARVLRDYLNDKPDGPRWDKDAHIEEASDTGYYIEEGDREGEFFLVRYEPKTPNSVEAEDRVVYGRYLVISDEEVKQMARDRLCEKVAEMPSDNWLVAGVKAFLDSVTDDKAGPLVEFLVSYAGYAELLGVSISMATRSDLRVWTLHR